MSDRGAQLASIAIAEHKARTAARYRRPTVIFENAVQKFGFNYILLMPVVVKLELHRSAGALGLLLSSLGAGALIGGVAGSGKGAGVGAVAGGIGGLIYDLATQHNPK